MDFMFIWKINFCAHKAAKMVYNNKCNFILLVNTSARCRNRQEAFSRCQMDPG